jgi:glycosyltransferase involved in cell wall biosynthesis
LSASSFETDVRILYLADIRFPLERANGIQTMETCCALADRGHEVRLVVRPDTERPPRDPFEFYGLARHARVLVQRTAVYGPPAMRRMAYLAQALGNVASARLRSRVDVVITRDLGAASLLLGLPRSMRPPLVYESHGFAPVFAEWMPEMLSGGAPASGEKLRRLLGRETRVWRGAEGYVTITEGLARDLTERLGPRDHLSMIPDGVRLAPGRRFAPPRESASPMVAYSGHLYPWKGVDVLLRALALLPAARGLIVGGHPAERDRDRLEALADTLRIRDRVRFTGLVPHHQVTALLEQADVLVMPHTATPVSERYASPLKLFEYMALGKPIVASDLSAVREVLRDGETACLVKASDSTSLASGITKVLEHPDLAEQIARRAFDAAASYTWARRAERLDALLGVVTRPS